MSTPPAQTAPPTTWTTATSEVTNRSPSTVRFDFANDGAIVHEAMLGDAHQQDEFATEGGHDGGHAEADHHGDVHAITLEAGESGSLVVGFDQPGEMMIGCHIPGHWDAGMAATFTVS
jgi:uncharacterized cupredoxin-like copper-binding protein